MNYYAVIDTNVFLSALITKRDDTATVRVLELHRKKFKIPENIIRNLMASIIRYGVNTSYWYFCRYEVFLHEIT